MNFPMGVRTALKMTARSMVAAPSDFLGRNHNYKRRAIRGQFCGRPLPYRGIAERTATGDLCEIELPGNSIAIVHPSEHAAEPVFAERHWSVTVGHKRSMQLANFVFGIAFDEKRECWCKRKLVLDRAVGAQDRLASNAKACFHHRTFDPGPVRTITNNS